MPRLMGPVTPAAIALAAVVAAPSLGAQGRWVPPDDACKVPGNHFLLRSASLYLKQASETGFAPERDRFMADATRVLGEAVTTAELIQSPTTWYWQGRLYSMRRDVVGADTAFRRAEALEPGCHDDIARWRKELAPHTLHAAALALQAQQADSAIRLLQLVQSMDPEDPRGLVELVRLWVERDQLDSAKRALDAAYAVTTADTAVARHRREAHLAVIRAYRQRVTTEQASARLAAARGQLQPLGEAIATDSTILAEMLADVAKIRARGAKLDPQSLQAVQAESTSRSDRLARTRARRDTVTRALAADSAAVERVLAPAIAAYTEFLASAPHLEAAAELAGLYAIRGDSQAVNRVVDGIVAGAGDARESALLLAGNSLLGAGQPAAATKLLAAALSKNPLSRNGLLLLARAHLGRGAPDSALATARALAVVDPLNDQPHRLLAIAFTQLGNADSAKQHQLQADSGATLVTVTQFQPTTTEATVGGTVRNRGGTPLLAFTLVFQFLGPDGAPVAEQTVEVPQIDAGGFHSFSVRALGKSIVAWRYRPR